MVDEAKDAGQTHRQPVKLHLNADATLCETATLHCGLVMASLVECPSAPSYGSLP